MTKLKNKPAFPKKKTAHEKGPEGMTYYEWLVGQLANNSAFVGKYHSGTCESVALNILRIADILIEKMENERSTEN